MERYRERRRRGGDVTRRTRVGLAWWVWIINCVVRTEGSTEVG